MASKPVLLVTTAYPKSAEAREKLLAINPTSVFRDPAVNATSSLYLDLLPPRVNYPNLYEYGSLNPIVAITVFESEDSIAALLNSPEYQKTREQIQSEGLYAKPEAVETYYPLAGFLARGSGSDLTDQSFLIKMYAKEGQNDGYVKAMSSFCKYIQEAEPETLTYSLWKNKDANEYLMFERYVNVGNVDAHVTTARFKQFHVEADPHLLLGQTTVSQFKELDGSFMKGQVY